MTSKTVGLPFRDYQQYCDTVDEALASIRAPLMNGLPAAKVAQQMILDKRMFFIKNQDHVLIFNAYVGYYKLYYAAEETATLAIPSAGVPVVAEQLRLETKEYPHYDALMKNSGFSLSRVNIGMARKLDETLKMELYVQADVPDSITVALAVPGEFFKINKLLRTVFDPLLDELPSNAELRQIIEDRHVFVIRDHEKVAATMIRIPKGTTAMMHWIAVDKNYRKLKLSGLIAFAGDEDSKKKGFHQISIWVDQRAGGWIEAIIRRGYFLTGQHLYTYVFQP